MKEDEAKAKWCPMTRVPLDSFKNTVSANRCKESGAMNNSQCIASDCAMWVCDESEGSAEIGRELGESLIGHCGLIK